MATTGKLLKLFREDNFITFIEKTHQYFDPDKDEYESVSRVLKTVEKPFDAKAISLAMSGGNREKAKKLRDSWKVKKDSSIDRGNWIHGNLESYVKEGICDDQILPVAKEISYKYLRHYHAVFPEKILYHKYAKIAGTSDLVLWRQKNSKVVDFGDYKTNEANGIRFETIKLDIEGNWEKCYNNYLLSPLDYMEASIYNKYALQLSIYAYMAEKTYGIQVGKLFIIYIDNDFQDHYYPVPYMKQEAVLVMKNFVSLKQIA